MFRGAGDPCHRVIAANFLDLQDVDRILLVAEREREVLMLFLHGIRFRCIHGHGSGGR
jgi:hypothetical protein